MKHLVTLAKVVRVLVWVAFVLNAFTFFYFMFTTPEGMIASSVGMVVDLAVIYGINLFIQKQEELLV